MAAECRDFVMGTEEECLSVLLGPSLRNGVHTAFSRLAEHMAPMAPQLCSPNGFFNGYGRLLVDAGAHIELSSAECDSPYVLAQVVERQHCLVGRALEAMSREGVRLVLANNNHSGLLTPRASTWGAHESYLVEVHPQRFGELILPFLATRIYAGAGGVLAPTGTFVACVRALRMRLATGGDTTSTRAIHSTARDESLMDGSNKRHRYHLISADGHRSQFNLALQFGATALAVKAIQHVAVLPWPVESMGLPWRGSWPATMRRLNVLARGGGVRVHPLVMAVQRAYLEAARRYRASLSQPPDWIERTLRDWEDTLAAFERGDVLWLSARLDAFAKHALYTQVLAAEGKTWADLAGDKALLCRLALLDQNYHEFGNPASVFERLEQAGLLAHRVGPRIEPGGEDEPFVPETGTRARARARFIRENAGKADLVMEWSAVHDPAGRRWRSLSEPFAGQYGDWQEAGWPSVTDPHLLHNVVGRLRTAIRTAYVRGLTGQVLAGLPVLEQALEAAGTSDDDYVLKHRAWTRTQAGYTDGDRLLARAYREDVSGFEACVDHVALRTLELAPPPNTNEWIARGFAALERARDSGDAPGELRVERFQELVGEAWTRMGRAGEAAEILEQAASVQSLLAGEPRQHGKLLATMGENQRVLGAEERARELLERACAMQQEHEHMGILVENTYPSLAKLERDPARALSWIGKARALLVDRQNVVGRVRVLLLEARLAGPGQTADENRAEIERLRANRPLLSARRSALLARILDGWQAWVSGALLAGESDRFWRL